MKNRVKVLAMISLMSTGLSMNAAASETAVSLGVDTITDVSELEDFIESKVETVVDSLNEDFEDLESSITTYNEFVDNEAEVQAFYDRSLRDTQELCITLKEYCVVYAELVLASDQSARDKYDVMGDLYDWVYDDACDDIYDDIYDDLMDDLYDAFYDGVIDDKDEDISYSEWSEVRSREYSRWSHTRSDIYKTWSDARSDIYDFYSDVKNAFYKEKDDRVQKKIDKLIKDIDKDREKIERSESAEENARSTEADMDDIDEAIDEIADEIADEVSDGIADEDSAEVEQEPEKDAASSEELVDGMRPDFKEAMDSYRDFMITYVDFMKSYDSSDISMLTEYMKLLENYAEALDEFEEWESEDLNAAELAYYTKISLEVLELYSNM